MNYDSATSATYNIGDRLAMRATYDSYEAEWNVVIHTGDTLTADSYVSRGWATTREEAESLAIEGAELALSVISNRPVKVGA